MPKCNLHIIIMSQINMFSLNFSPSLPVFTFLNRDIGVVSYSHLQYISILYPLPSSFTSRYCFSPCTVKSLSCRQYHIFSFPCRVRNLISFLSVPRYQTDEQQEVKVAEFSHPACSPFAVHSTSEVTRLYLLN